MMMKLSAFLPRHDLMIDIHHECTVALNAVSRDHLREEAGLISRREFDAAFQIEEMFQNMVKIFREVESIPEIESRRGLQRTN